MRKLGGGNPFQIFAKSTKNHSQISPGSALGAFGVPKSLPERPRPFQETPQEAPRAPMGPTRGAPRATQAPQRAPKKRQRAPQRALGRGKSIPRRSPKRKSSILSKVLRAPPLPTRGALRSSPDHPEITPESLQIGAPTPSRGPLDRLCSLEGDSGALDDRSRSTQAASGRRPRPPRAQQRNPIPRQPEAPAENIE